jgi:cytochrome c oxidase subunit 4
MTHPHPHTDKPEQGMAYGLYVKVWLALVIGTALTLAASYVDLQRFVVFNIMLIATVKATLVLLYFMHLRYERRMYAVMILVVLITYGIFIFLTFADYLNR